MKEELIQYVNLLFAGAHDCEDIRQEILQNTLDRYDDLIAQGKVPEAAYRLAISGIGDIQEILGTPTASPTVDTAPSRKNRKHLLRVLMAILIGILAVLSATFIKNNVWQTIYAIEEPLDEAQVYQKAVATTELSVRSSPNLNASVLATVPNGETVLIGHTETISGNDWAYILGSTDGWVSMEFLELYSQDTTQETSVSEVVNVYSMPSLDAENIASFAKGDPVTIEKTETVDGKLWNYITEPVAGWVMAEELDDARLSDQEI